MTTIAGTPARRRSLELADLPDEKKEEIEGLRRRQIKNFLTLLFVSQGTPMLLYGDEMRRRLGEKQCGLPGQQTELDRLGLHASIPNNLCFTQLIIGFGNGTRW